MPWHNLNTNLGWQSERVSWLSRRLLGTVRVRSRETWTRAMCYRGAAWRKLRIRAANPTDGFMFGWLPTALILLAMHNDWAWGEFARNVLPQRPRLSIPLTQRECINRCIIQCLLSLSDTRELTPSARLSTVWDLSAEARQNWRCHSQEGGLCIGSPTSVILLLHFPWLFVS